MTARAEWPELDYPKWKDTLLTLQLWTQIVGKVRLSLSPWVNHSWQVPLYVTARGLGTSPMVVGGEVLELEFDFLAQQLRLQTSAGEVRSLALVPRSVADFHGQLLGLLRELGITVAINPRPSEIAAAIPFAQDHVHASYDGAAAQRFWRALLQADRLLKLFRSGFIGKVSPVHFFWGSFDLAVTRFSGRRAPPHPGGVPGLPDAVVREAYSHEVSSAGFWPGSDAFPEAAFYSYAYPEPPGFRQQAGPGGARYEAALGEYVLPYAAVRAAAQPDQLVLDFLGATYAAAADTARWDRAALECALGVPGRVRALS
jgi:Family of unknown function (DUF5996)